MVILYNPVSSSTFKPVLPLSLLALASMLEGREPYRIIDGNLERDDGRTLELAIDEARPEILAITVMPGPQLSDAAYLSRRLKQKYPHLTVVWGGYFPSQHYEAVLSSEFVDFVMRGHAEYSFYELVKCLKSAESPAHVDGLCFRRPDTGEPHANRLPPIPEIDQLPDFPYERLPMERYVRETFMGRTLSHHSSYGCPFLCNFCAVVNLARGRWKAQSGGRTARITQELVYKWGAEAVEFFDNNFFVDEKRVLEFSARIKQLHIRWWGEGRVDTLLGYSGDTWKAMADSGLTMVFMGAESGSEKTLRSMDKGGRLTVDQTVSIAELMGTYGIIPEFSFILGNPPDPETDTDRTFNLVKQLKSVNPRSEIIFYLYTPVPFEGGLYAEVAKSGFAFPQTLDGWLEPRWFDFSLRRSASLPWIDASLVRRIRNFERVLNAQYPTSTDMKLTLPRRFFLRLAAGWRYHTGFWSFPVELMALQKLFKYQRPETSGF